MIDVEFCKGFRCAIRKKMNATYMRIYTEAIKQTHCVI